MLSSLRKSSWRSTKIGATHKGVAWDNREADRCALACAFLAKAVLDLKTTRALIDRLQGDSKLRRLCGFDLRFALPSESTFSRAFEEFARDELMQRVHARMIEDTLGNQLIGHISRDSTAE